MQRCCQECRRGLGWTVPHCAQVTMLMLALSSLHPSGEALLVCLRFGRRDREGWRSGAMDELSVLADMVRHHEEMRELTKVGGEQADDDGDAAERRKPDRHGATTWPSHARFEIRTLLHLCCI